MRIELSDVYVTYARESAKIGRALAKGKDAKSGERVEKAKKKCVIKGLSATFESGKLYRITGGNGSGKTTLLKLMSGLIKPINGKIVVDGCEVLSKNAFILQEATAIAFAEAELAFFAPNVLEELTLPYKLTGKNQAEAERETRGIIEKMKLGELVKKSPLILSKGEKQRLAFAIILMKIYVGKAVKFVFLDEPTSALDNDGLLIFYTFLEELFTLGIGVIIVNHDQKEGEALVELGAEILRLESGRLVEKEGIAGKDGDKNTRNVGGYATNGKFESVDYYTHKDKTESLDNIAGNQKTQKVSGDISQISAECVKTKTQKSTELDPRTKIFALVAISTFAVLTKSLVGLGLLLIVAILVDLFVKADILYAVKTIKGLLGMIFFIAIMQSLTVKGGDVYVAIFGIPLITSYGIVSAASFALRMLILVCSALIISKNDKTELVVALERMAIPNFIAVMTVVAIGFIPVVREEYMTRLGALKMRGINIKGTNIITKIKTYSYLLAPTLAGSIIYSERLAQTMTSRAFRVNKRPTYYRRLHLKYMDYFAILLIVLFIAAGIFAMIIF